MSGQEEVFAGLISEREYDLLSNVEAIGCDWSGTVSRDIDSAWTANKRVCDKLGLSIEEDAVEWGRHPAASPVADYEARLSDPAVDSSTKDSLRKLGPGGFVGLFLSEYQQVLKDRRDLWPTPLPGAVEAVKKISHMMRPLQSERVQQYMRQQSSSQRYLPPIFILSSIPKDVLISEVRRFGIDIESDLWCCVGGVGDKSTEMRRIVVEEMGIVDTRHAVYVGDTASDVSAAKRAGLTSVAVTCGYHSVESLIAQVPDLIYPSVSAFSSYLELAKKTTVF